MLTALWVFALLELQLAFLRTVTFTAVLDFCGFLFITNYVSVFIVNCILNFNYQSVYDSYLKLIFSENLI